MKYEAVFGDQSLFDGVSGKAIIVIKNNNSKYVITEHESSDIFQLTLCQPNSYIAMRRIILEPKRWTWEDKVAGRLPEVGCDIQYIDSQKRVSVIAINSNEIVLLAKSNGSKFFVLNPDSLLQYYNPIETPAEKAQREEDAFVDVIVSEYNKMPSSISFKAGIRAAYRKLKGGE